MLDPVQPLEYETGLLDDTQSCYQLFITIQFSGTQRPFFDVSDYFFHLNWLTVSRDKLGLLSSKSRGNKSKIKLGKISLAESLSKVTNSSILENPQFSRVTGCCYGYCDKLWFVDASAPWLADVTVRFLVFDYSQLPNFIVRFQPYTTISEN